MKSISMHIDLDESVEIQLSHRGYQPNLDHPPELRICSFVGRFAMLNLTLPHNPAEALEVAEKLHGATMQLLEDTERWVNAMQKKADRS